MPAHVIDTALDRSVVLGYGRLGPSVRRRLDGWPADPPRLDGKTVLVTGAASGLGLAACQGYARLGATVHALARDERRAEHARQLIADSVPGADVHGEVCDLSSLSGLRAFATRFAAGQSRLDVLINNAGVMPAQRRETPDGNELMFATHVLAPFALTAWLDGLLGRSAPARIINVSSGGMYGQRLVADDLQSQRIAYSATRIYARTKRQEVVISELWARRLRDSGVVVHAMHPGWVETEGLRKSLPLFRTLTRPIIRTPADGADTIVWLGGAPEALRCTGRFWHDRRPRPTHHPCGPGRDSEAERERLWNDCQTIIDRAAAEPV